MNSHFARHRYYQVVLTVFSLSLFTGCGKDDGASQVNSGSSLRGANAYSGGPLYQVGDQVRNRVRLKTATGFTEMETIMMISGINENHSAYEVKKFQVVSTVRTLVTSEWRSSESLSDLAISDLNELKMKCAASQGKMGQVLVGGKPTPVCKTKAPWPKGNQIIGRCDVWLGVLPFGIFKESCVSSDGRQSVVSEALSAVVQGSHRYF